MRRVITALTTVGIASALIVSIPNARKSEREANNRIKPAASYHTKGLSDLPLEHPSRAQSKAITATVLAEYTFDTGGLPDPQGWTSVDRTVKDRHFHVDGSAGDMNSSGCLVPLEGSQSLWCGFPYAACTPSDVVGGYGNKWYDTFASDTLHVQGDVTVSYLVSYDTEPSYDYGRFQYYDFSNSTWQTVRQYNGKSCREIETVTIPSAEAGDSTRFRFVFSSDGGWSDEDCAFYGEGAIIIDSLTIEDATGVIDFRDFESEPLGALATGDGLWEAEEWGFGDYAALYDAFGVLQEDPCHASISSVWGFFADPAIANYGCKGHPEQGAIPQNIEYPFQAYIHNEIWSPWIELVGVGSSVVLEFDVYRDLEMIDDTSPGIYYTWSIRSLHEGDTSAWVNDNYVYFGDPEPDWLRASFEVGHHIWAGADTVQLSLGVWELGYIWGFAGPCHSHAPLFDNVTLLRYVVPPGPVWNVRDGDLFQDNFASDGTTSGTVRADIAFNDPEGSSQGYAAGDSMAVTVYGLGPPIVYYDPLTGCGPAVYLHVKDLPGKSGTAIQAPHLAWDLDCAGYLRFPVADSSGGWTTIRCDYVRYDGLPVANRYSVDLKDDVYTPGDTVYFYFSARDSVGTTNYWSRYTGTTTSEDDVRSAPMEMTCLPANALAGKTDILYVDRFDQRGAQPYFEAAFEALGITPDRYDVRSDDALPGSRVRSVTNQLIPPYTTIIWNTGDLPRACIGDGTLAGVADDATMLFDFLDQHTDNAAVYFSGDDLAEEWAGLSGPGAVSLRTYMDYTLVNPDHVAAALPVSPLVIGQAGSIFDHSGDVDSLVAFGGCPSMNDFDVLGPGVSSSVAARYDDNPALGAVLIQETINGVGNTARVALSGFSYHKIRDVEEDTPANIEHLLDILNWAGLAGSYSPVCQVSPTSLDFGMLFVDSVRTETFTIENLGAGVLAGTVVDSCAHYTIVDGAYSLGPGQSHVVTVRYQPTTIGTHTCTIETGLIDCADVLCTGVADLLPECAIEPTSIDFGIVDTLSVVDTTFTIVNTGGWRLEGTVNADTCAYFSIEDGGGSYSLATGETLSVKVRFQPTVLETLTCTIETGDTACADILCTGIGEPPPVCLVQPTTLWFDSVFVGSWKDDSLLVTNTGGLKLTGSVSADTCGHYSLQTGAGPYALAHDESLWVTVRFEPTVVGSLTCSVETGDALCSDVSCTGYGEPLPSCLVQPATLAFDTVFVGSWRDDSLLVTNTGGGILTGSVSADTCGHYSIQDGGGPYSLAADESLWVTVRFEPSVAGSLTCSVDTGDELCSDIPCTGVGWGAVCQIEPAGIDFDSVFVGSWMDTSFIITNAGGDTLRGSVSAPCPHYSIESGGGPYTLGHDDSLTVTVRFEPAVAGTLICSIETGDTTCSDVSCTGYGELLPSCLVQPTTLDFDSVLVGSWKDELFLITNTGGGTLTGSVGDTCSYYSVLSGGGPYSLAAEESLWVTVRFEPTVAGSLTCSIETGDSLCSDVSCTGFAELPAACLVVPASLDFGAVAVGSINDLPFTIKNTGGQTLDGTVSEACSLYSIVSGGGPYSLAADESVVVTVRFAPTEAGVYPCTIETGDGLCSDVDVTGLTAGPMIVVSPSSIDFGRSGTGTIRDTTFVIKSVGLGTLDGTVSEACSHYSIESGAGPFSLASGESLVVGIRYAPTAYGLHECLIGTNPSFGNVLAFVADGFLGLEVIDVGDPANPVFTAYHDTPDYAWDIYVSGNHAFVVDRDYGLQVIDISNPAAPTLVGSYDTPGQTWGIDVSGDHAYMLGYVLGLLVIDISDPSTPTLSGSYDPGSTADVFVSGDYAYVAGHDEGLHVIDVSDPAAPALAGTYDTPASANGVYVLGDLAYVADGNSGLRVIDVSDPAAPTEVGGYDTLGDSRGVYVSGDYAYVADGTAGLKVIDISDPSTPTLAGSYAYGSPSYSQNVYLLGDYAYVADGMTGLHVIDVSNPAAPTLTGAYDTPGSVNDVAVVPNGSVACTGYVGFEHAMIDSIVDIPNDQGGQVRIHMTRSIYDFVEETELPIYAYQVWRRLDEPAALAALESVDENSSGGKKPGADRPTVVSAKVEAGDLPDWPLIEWKGRRFLSSQLEILGDGFPAGTWESVNHVFAVQQQNYIVATSTLADSSQSGIPWAVFVITAHTTTPAIWFTSPIDSGYSVDNIAPGVPQGFAVAYNTGSGNQLAWDPSPEPDFQYYRVFRGSDKDFTPDSTNVVHETATPSWTDPDYDGGWVHYKITAVDHAGNESPPGSPATVTTIRDVVTPKTFALYQNVPNPFNPTTVIRYDVPEGEGHVTLRVYDVKGRLVRTLVDGPQSAGEKSVMWNGRNSQGHPVATGVYFYRMTAPGFAMTKKMVLLQ